MNELDDIAGLRLFERVVSLGSLTAAANELGLSLAVASKRLSKFENRLGTQLIHRSTRRLSISDEGRLLYDYAQRVMQELQHAEEALLQKKQRLSGTLKITSPNSFGHRHLLALLTPFQQRYPEIQLQLFLSDDIEDLIAAGIDVAIRYGQLPDSRLVARKLLNNQRILCASPEYLAEHGQPKNLQDLQQHRCIIIHQHNDTEWRFKHGNVPIHASICCNDGEAVHTLALNGMGIALKSYWDIADDLKHGRLQQVLADHAYIDAPISAVYLRNANLAPRVRVFIDFLFEQMQQLDG